MSTTTLPPIVPPLEVFTQPPTLTHNQALLERREANLAEAWDIVASANLDAAAAAVLAELVGAALAAAEDRGYDRYAPRAIPTLIRVFDWPPDHQRPPDPADGGVIDPADYDQPCHGLQCPHCGTVTWEGEDSGIYVIDVSERWSRFGYDVRRDQPQQRYETYEALNEAGRKVWRGRYVDTGERADEHRVVGSYGDGEHHSVGYSCESCERRVALPEGVAEEGN